MRYHFIFLYAFVLALLCSGKMHGPANIPGDNADSSFNVFQTKFLDFYWQQNPAGAISAGYGKYYDKLIVPDSTAFASEILFSRTWLDSLHNYNYNDLNDDNKINYAIVQNQLQSTLWYIDTFKIQQWDPSAYNIGGECYYILTQGYAPLTRRLQILSAHLQRATEYYAAALKIIYRPTREYTTLAIQQNLGSLDVFGSALADSIKISSLSGAEKDTLQRRIIQTTSAIKNYAASLQKMLTDKNYTFRDFRIGKELFAQKFKYDLVSNYTPEEIFVRATNAKNDFHKKMYGIAVALWPKYNPSQAMPSDSLLVIKNVLDKISLTHAKPGDVVSTATALVHQLQQFIVQKKLFDYDTTYPLQVRIMPAFMGGVALANAEFTPPYQKKGTTYYNVSDITKMPAADAESELREYNTYSLQFLSIHEAMPGHCLQGVYSNKQSSGSMVKSVFQNGAMIEGWAVYSEQMMMENGWGNNAPELWLTLYKWRLRELSNVLIDYGLQCLHYSEKDIYALLKNETFQEDAQIKEKYHRATVSQVQLCSYFTGLTDILALREAYKNKQGSGFRLKDFHEKFLSYGSSPVKYIRDMMLK